MCDILSCCLLDKLLKAWLIIIHLSLYYFMKIIFLRLTKYDRSHHTTMASWGTHNTLSTITEQCQWEYDYISYSLCHTQGSNHLSSVTGATHIQQCGTLIVCRSRGKVVDTSTPTHATPTPPYCLWATIGDHSLWFAFQLTVSKRSHLVRF